jgi:hypothetical protein
MPLEIVLVLRTRLESRNPWQKIRKMKYLALRGSNMERGPFERVVQIHTGLSLKQSSINFFHCQLLGKSPKLNLKLS